MYEIESRVFFDSEKEAYEMMPFLDSLISFRVEWETSMHGINLFNDDRIFRFSKVWTDNQTWYYLGYKDPDIGRKCNVRLEIDEDVTNGFAKSNILEKLGIKLPDGSPELIPKLLESAGYPEYMSFEGYSLMRRDKERQLAFKLMFCDKLEYKILFEFETTAELLADAYKREEKILSFIREFNLEEHVVKDEPTTLLYKNVMKENQ